MKKLIKITGLILLAMGLISLIISLLHLSGNRFVQERVWQFQRLQNRVYGNHIKERIIKAAEILESQESKMICVFLNDTGLVISDRELHENENFVHSINLEQQKSLKRFLKLSKVNHIWKYDDLFLFSERRYLQNNRDGFLYLPKGDSTTSSLLNYNYFYYDDQYISDKLYYFRMK